MISLRLLTRNVTPQLAASSQRLHTSKIFLDANSSDSSDSDTEKPKKKHVSEPKKAKDNAETEKSVHGLNAMLQSMAQQAKVQSKVNVAVNPKKPKPRKPQFSAQDSPATGKLFEDKLAGAAREVATSLGGDVNKTESELLKKILTPNKTDQEPIDLSKLVMGMNIDRTKSTGSDTSSSRADHVRLVMQRTNRFAPQRQQQQEQRQFEKPKMRQGQRSGAQSMPSARVDIDSGSPMGFFTAETEAVHDSDAPVLNTWDLLERKELQLLVTHPPVNFLEQMIRWTEQGRLWRFPIDNEQDMHIGQEEHFSEHIFLEQHLEGWCPPKGPIRHFMELVCVGLSKNPYMFAKDKRERIMWFKNYFAEKHDLLKELGAFGTEALQTGDGDKKQIQA